MRGGPRDNVVVLTRQSKTLLDERLHFLQVGLQLFLGVAVTQEISAQPHARDRILKTARDPRQNLDPFHSLLGNASLHGVERRSGARHFLRTILRERLTAQIRAQAVGRVLEARQRLRRELYGNPDEECDNTELNGERRRQPGRNDFPRRKDLERQRAAVLQVHEYAPSQSLRWIEVDKVRVEAGPQQGPQTRDVRLSSFGWLRFQLSPISQSVSIIASREAVEPGGSLFRQDVVEDSDRVRDVHSSKFTPPLVFDSDAVEGNQNEGQHMCSHKAGKQDHRQPAEQRVRPETRRHTPKTGAHDGSRNASTEAAN